MGVSLLLSSTEGELDGFVPTHYEETATLAPSTDATLPLFYAGPLQGAQCAHQRATPVPLSSRAQPSMFPPRCFLLSATCRQKR